MARWYKLRSIGWHPSPTKRKSYFPSRHCLKWNVGTHFFHLCASLPTTSGRAPLSHPTSSIPGDHIYGRIDRQRAAFLFEFLQLAIELPPPPLPFLFSHKSSEKQPFYADRRRRRQLCSLPRSLTHLMLFPYLLLAREKKERIGERRERICSNGLLWRQISGGGEDRARENYGEKLALSSPSLLPPSLLLPE